MAESVLPGVYITVNAEGLITPGRVTVGNLGIVGTASKGPIGKPVALSSYADAREVFGDYDPWQGGDSDELTLVRALELAFGHGATAVYAVRVASDTAQEASYVLNSAGGPCVELKAKTPGTWGNTLAVTVWDADEPVFVQNETHPGGASISLKYTPVINSARNRIRVFTSADGLTRSMAILYEDPGTPLAANQVLVNLETGALTFGQTLAAGDEVTASYLVATKDAADVEKAVKVTLVYGQTKETYSVVSGDHLIEAIAARPSTLVEATAAANSAELPSKIVKSEPFPKFNGGDDGAIATPEIYKGGLDLLLESDVQIIHAAGQDHSFGDELDAHCQQASTDEIKRDRIAVVGSGLSSDIDQVLNYNFASDRVIYVAPGIKQSDVTLPGAYAAAAVAGLLAGLPPHISPTNKTLRVGDVQERYNSAKLAQLLNNRVLALETRQGVRIVRGVTTSTNTAWTQITTRRIVDYAKYGVRSAASSYIGLLNNDRVRGALRATINSFLAEMVTDEMLVSYTLDVTATREQERQGIVRVNMTLRPVFSIDYIKVTMFLD